MNYVKKLFINSIEYGVLHMEDDGTYQFLALNRADGTNGSALVRMKNSDGSLTVLAQFSKLDPRFYLLGNSATAYFLLTPNYIIFDSGGFNGPYVILNKATLTPVATTLLNNVTLAAVDTASDTVVAYQQGGGGLFGFAAYTIAAGGLTLGNTYRFYSTAINSFAWGAMVNGVLLLSLYLYAAAPGGAGNVLVRVNPGFNQIAPWYIRSSVGDFCPSATVLPIGVNAFLRPLSGNLVQLLARGTTGFDSYQLDVSTGALTLQYSFTTSGITYGANWAAGGPYFARINTEIDAIEHVVGSSTLSLSKHPDGRMKADGSAVSYVPDVTGSASFGATEVWFLGADYLNPGNIWVGVKPDINGNKANPNEGLLVSLDTSGAIAPICGEFFTQAATYTMTTGVASSTSFTANAALTYSGTDAAQSNLATAYSYSLPAVTAQLLAVCSQSVQFWTNFFGQYEV